MTLLDTLSKNSFAFLGITLILVVVIVVAFLSIEKPFDAAKNKGAEKVLNIEGTDTILFEGNGCRCEVDYNSVCGNDGKTYFNPCFARCANVGFFDGVCQTSGATCTSGAGSAAPGQACDQDTECQAGTACIEGVCVEPENAPGNEQRCGILIDFEGGTLVWNPMACAEGLTCQKGICRPTPQNLCDALQSESPCVETDGGNSPFISGIVSGAYNGEQGEYRDSCTGLVDQNEYYCESPASNVVLLRQTQCPALCDITNGACQQPQPGCSEDDGGDAPAVAGTTRGTDERGEQVTQEDSCTEVQGVSGPIYKFTEYYCNAQNGAVAQTEYDCTNDCRESRVCEGAEFT